MKRVSVVFLSCLQFLLLTFKVSYVFYNNVRLISFYIFHVNGILRNREIHHNYRRWYLRSPSHVIFSSNYNSFHSLHRLESG